MTESRIRLDDIVGLVLLHKGVRTVGEWSSLLCIERGKILRVTKSEKHMKIVDKYLVNCDQFKILLLRGESKDDVDFYRWFLRYVRSYSRSSKLCGKLWRTTNREYVRERAAVYKKTNRKEVLALKKAYRKRNKEKLLAIQNTYRKKNKQSPDYYIRNREKMIAQAKEYRKMNKEKVVAQAKEYRKRNKEKISKYNREYRMRHCGNIGA